MQPNPLRGLEQSVGVVARALFEAGADPEACDGHGRKPLDCAISAANTAFIEAALDAGADPRPTACKVQPHLTVNPMRLDHESCALDG